VTVVRKSEKIDAPADKIMKIMLDVTDHPTWMKEITQIEVLESDGAGRPLQTKVHVSAMGQAATYEVRYQYNSPRSFEYHLVAGDIMTSNDFIFEVEPVADAISQVSLAQELTVKWPLPGFIVDQLTLKGVKDMLKQLAAKANSA